MWLHDLVVTNVFFQICSLILQVPTSARLSCADEPAFILIESLRYFHTKARYWIAQTQAPQTLVKPH